jgi:hypothetical protein
LRAKPRLDRTAGGGRSRSDKGEEPATRRSHGEGKGGTRCAHGPALPTDSPTYRSHQQPASERRARGELPGLLAPFVSENHARFALLSVRPFAPSEASEGRGLPCSAPRSATTASADFSLRDTRVTASPFQARGEISPGKNRRRRCTLAAFTPSVLGREGFAVSCPLALTRGAFYAVSVRRPAAVALRFFRPRPRGLRLAIRSGFLRPGTPEDFHLLVTVHAGHTKRNPTFA